jgi:hypothetical protein
MVAAASVRKFTRADVGERARRQTRRQADKSLLLCVPDGETLTNANADGPDRSREAVRVDRLVLLRLLAAGCAAAPVGHGAGRNHLAGVTVAVTLRGLGLGLGYRHATVAGADLLNSRATVLDLVRERSRSGRSPLPPPPDQGWPRQRQSAGLDDSCLPLPALEKAESFPALPGPAFPSQKRSRRPDTSCNVHPRVNRSRGQPWSKATKNCSTATSSPDSGADRR